MYKRQGKFEEITQDLNWEKATNDDSYGATALDLDHDGDTDMLVARQSGVWLHLNDNGQFTAKLLDLDLDPKTVPLSVALSDLNRDGLYDMYVSGYIGREFVEGETIFNQEYGGISGLYINTGDHTFRNITKEAGMYYQHNTFQGVFIDIDNDQLEDLVVAHDTGQVRTWKNLGDLKFENLANPTSDYFAYPMGIAVSDYDNDQRPDFFFSNVGSTVPASIVRGDLRDDQVLNQKWIMFHNEGGFTFSDSAEEVKVADYEFSWGAIFEDFNLDGRDDLVVSENYAGWPVHKIPFLRSDGRFLLQTEDNEFAEAGPEAGVQNRYFGISPLTADFNQDGRPDLVHINILGPQKVFLSQAKDNHNFLKIQLDNTVASIGSKVTVTLENGETIHQTFVVGEGLCSDQSHVMIFGLGQQSAREVSVKNINGTSNTQSGNFRNQTLTI